MDVFPSRLRKIRSQLTGDVPFHKSMQINIIQLIHHFVISVIVKVMFHPYSHLYQWWPTQGEVSQGFAGVISRNPKGFCINRNLTKCGPEFCYKLVLQYTKTVLIVFGHRLTASEWIVTYLKNVWLSSCIFVSKMC